MALLHRQRRQPFQQPHLVTEQLDSMIDEFQNRPHDREPSNQDNSQSEEQDDGDPDPPEPEDQPPEPEGDSAPRTSISRWERPSPSAPSRCTLLTIAPGPRGAPGANGQRHAPPAATSARPSRRTRPPTSPSTPRCGPPRPTRLSGGNALTLTLSRKERELTRRPPSSSSRTTCGRRCARPRPAASSSSWWTPAAPWARSAAWWRSRAQSCPCCSTPTSAATASASSPSVARGAQVLLPPTSSVDLAHALLSEMPTGGRTPLSRGLLLAMEVIETEKQKDRNVLPLLVVLSDGRANVAMGSVKCRSLSVPPPSS